MQVGSRVSEDERRGVQTDLAIQLCDNSKLPSPKLLLLLHPTPPSNKLRCAAAGDIRADKGAGVTALVERRLDISSHKPSTRCNLLAMANNSALSSLLLSLCNKMWSCMPAEASAAQLVWREGPITTRGEGNAAELLAAEVANVADALGVRSALLDARFPEEPEAGVAATHVCQPPPAGTIAPALRRICCRSSAGAYDNEEAVGHAGAPG